MRFVQIPSLSNIVNVGTHKENCGPLSVLRISGVPCLAKWFRRQLITVDEVGEEGLVPKSRKNNRL